MTFDDNICYCRQVSLRKLITFVRQAHPQHVSQMAACLGAGTGCGWCIPMLQSILEKARASGEFDLPLKPEEYAAARDEYRRHQEQRHEFEPRSPTPPDNESS
ncbi:MAG: (2Fe-2S)-binding protein [Planctomycetes bacterium]|nr:(2Fe-2S)-binding protein [Planctomycetota bacterium]